MGEKKNLYTVLPGKYERKKALGRLRYRWEDDIKTDLRKIGH
jgi:hypothetical protein